MTPAGTKRERTTLDRIGQRLVYVQLCNNMQNQTLDIVEKDMCNCAICALDKTGRSWTELCIIGQNWTILPMLLADIGPNQIEREKKKKRGQTTKNTGFFFPGPPPKKYGKQR